MSTNNIIGRFFVQHPDPSVTDEIVLIGRRECFSRLSRTDVKHLVLYMNQCENIRKFVMLYFEAHEHCWCYIVNTLNRNRFQLKLLDLSTNKICYFPSIYNGLEFYKFKLSDMPCLKHIRSLDLSNVLFDIRGTHGNGGLDATDISKFIRETTTLEELKLNAIIISGPNELMMNGIAKNQSIKFLAYCNSDNKQIVFDSIARNRTIRLVTGMSVEEHGEIKSRRDTIRNELIPRIILLLQVEMLPPEMIAVVVAHIGLPVKYIGYNVTKRLNIQSGYNS